jgi:hypothetical protein
MISVSADTVHHVQDRVLLALGDWGFLDWSSGGGTVGSMVWNEVDI